MLKFIDLFAGIGGFHLAMHEAGARCVFSSDWNDAARETYLHNFDMRETGEPASKGDPLLAGDITKVAPESIPDHDILCGGFPCQSFSRAGHKLGFKDARGTLFFNICEILKAKRPKAVFLENVKDLATHDDGNTITVITDALAELGYLPATQRGEFVHHHRVS